MKKSLFLLIILSFAYTHPIQAAEVHPATVQDISDRAYEPAVIDLLDNAKESIVISMYIMSPSEKRPVALLMNDLAEALDRGVSVTIYLNSKAIYSKNAPTFSEKPFQVLKEKGAVILPVTSKYLLHDKLIIVDSRYVVEGSHNWSVMAMKVNFESSTLIDSPKLAREKLARLAALPLESARLAQVEKLQAFREASSKPKEGPVKLSSSLLEDEDFFPRMLLKRDDRTMNTYLLLAAKSQHLPDETSGGAFPVFIDNLVLELKIPAFWVETTKKAEVSEILRKLRDKYNLIDVKFQRGKEAWVTLKELPGDSFSVDSSFFDPDYLTTTRTRAKYVYLIKALLASRGTSLDSFTREEISKKFHIGIKGLRKGIKELGE